MSETSTLGRLCSRLGAYTPTWIGTFPLGLQVAGSDLDVACAADDLEAFEGDLRSAAAALGVTVTPERLPLSPPVSLTRLRLDGLEIEIFCQVLPVTAQAGFRHMIIEGRLLVIGGEPLRRQILAAKQAGQKTEPAFASVLGLPGDPFAAVLGLESWTDAALAGLVRKALAAGQHAKVPAVDIAFETGPRASLRSLFRLADDSEQAIDGYLNDGQLLGARADREIDGEIDREIVGEIVGVLLLTEAETESEGTAAEIKSLAVIPSWRGRGVGRRLVTAAIAHCRQEGRTTLLVATAAADTDLLRFYQRLGFRLLRIERDAFVPAMGYPAGLAVAGIPIRDRVWLSLTP
jgi:ribosomal protein S18 acetylase RimI-like enzyme